MAQVAAKTTSSNLPPHNASIFRLMDSHVALMAPLLLVAAAYFIVVYAVRENAKQRRLPIVPSIIPWLGNAFAFYRDPVKLLQSCKQKYGSVYKLLLAGQNIIIVNHPSGISSLHKDPTAFTPTPAHIHMLKVVAGLTHNREHVAEVLHTRLFPQIGKLLSPAAMVPITDDISQHLERELRTIGESKLPTVLRLDQFIGRPLYRATCLAFFGPAFPLDTFDDVHLLHSKLPQLTIGLPFVARDAIQARERILAKLEVYIKSIWAGEITEGVANVISDFVQELPGVLTPREAAGAILSFAFGFHFNTSYNLFWLIFHLLVDKDAYRLLTTELVDTRGPEPSTPLLDSTILETFRWATKMTTVRMANRNTSIVVDGEPISVGKGDYVIADVRSVHHDPDVYPSPEEFKIDRFLNIGASVKGIKPMPWGGGVHMCPGRHLAVFEMKHFLATSLRLYKIKALNKDGGGPTSPRLYKRNIIGTPDVLEDLYVEVVPVSTS